MANKDNVLVFSGATYPAMQIIDCLKNSPRFHVIAAASYSNHSEFVCDDCVSNLPFISAPEFLEVFVDLVTKRNIKYIIPTDESIALCLKEHEAQIPAIIICSSLEATRLCRHKKMTYEKLKGQGYIPRVYIADNPTEFKYPVFIKPDDSQGGRGARLINNAEEFRMVENPEKYVISEYLPGDEYTVDCFTNKDRKVIFANPRIRVRLMNGITARGYDVEYTDEFKEIIDNLNARIEFRGYWFAQLKRDSNGKLKLLEICTRFAGSFGISKSKGVNLPLLALCDFSGLPADVIVNDYVVEADKTYFERYRLSIKVDTVYIDYDDTVTYKEGKAVNPYVMGYLYQCKYQGKKIVLITRHQDTFHEALNESFKRLCISESLFDEIIEIAWKEEKYEHISERENAIFIDNSFAERKKVADNCNIPAFDVCNIDCLFDWRE